MRWLSICVFLLDVANHFFSKVTCSVSEFNLQGDYLLGGLFSLNLAFVPQPRLYPETLDCSSYYFDESSYQMFQMMRFAVEEINNLSSLLPNVSLGYEIFDHCSDMQNFPSVFSLFSQNGTVPVERFYNVYHPKVIAVTGPYESTNTITVAPFFTLDLIPMVDYGASTNELSNKLMYPSFLRTVPSNRDLIEIIILIIKWFGWNWVAFLGSKDDYSQDGLNLFYQYIRQKAICLAYQETFSDLSTDFRSTFQKIEKLNVKIIVVFSSKLTAEALIRSAIKNNVRNKVWIAGEGWSMDKQLYQEPGIENIGKILGITENVMFFPGFEEFINETQKKSKINNEECSMDCLGSPAKKMCNQVCAKCSDLSSEEILLGSPTFLFPVYSAIYTIAHGLHNVLKCDANGCSKSMPVYPYMLLQEIKNLNFTLKERQIKYDDNGNPSVSYAIIVWHPKAKPPEFKLIGSYNTYPEITFYINNSIIDWGNDGSVFFANCSVECKPGFQREAILNHDCCFQCNICPPNTYVNYSRDPYRCDSCNAGEWSAEGSTSCQKRLIVYLHFTSPVPIILMALSIILMIMCILIIALFIYNINTPVVKSAGGNMCFLMQASLILSSISVFFFFGHPTVYKCVFRNVLFYFFHTVCLSCMAVRSFQIVCVFKMAAKFPRAHKWWVNHNGQWLVIAIFSSFQFYVCAFWVSINTPRPLRDDATYNDQIILGCSSGNTETFYIILFFLWLLSVLCFSFSYMGADLPKNYNEAKSITFSMLLFYISWCFYFTADMVSKGTYIQLLNATAQLFSLYGILISYFIPKAYVIVFQPQKNTQAHFQTSIQNYTQTISRM